MTSLDISLLTGQQTAFEDPFNWKNYEEDRGKNCCVTKTFVFRVFGDPVRELDGRFSGRWRDPREAIGRFRPLVALAPGFSKWRWKSSLSGDEGGVQGRFNCEEREGSMSRFYERLAVTRMECVTSYVRCSSLCQCTEGRVSVALETSLNVHAMLSLIKDNAIVDCTSVMHIATILGFFWWRTRILSRESASYVARYDIT